jgi:SulP family sulfate permease
LGLGVLALILVWNRVVPRVPGYVVALVAGTVVVWVAQLEVETIGSRFGGIPAGLPEVSIPRFRADLILPLLSPTLTITVLGAIESLLSAVVADRMSRTRHNSNVELFAQGIANLVSPMVGGLPATGAIARTATNVRSGGRTPVAGMIHSATLLAVLLFAAPLAAAVPMAVLGAILLVVAYNMGEWREIPEIWRHGWTDRIVWLFTFALTVLADLTVAVEAGMIVAALLFIQRVAATTTVTPVTLDYVRRARVHALPAVRSAAAAGRADEPRGVPPARGRGEHPAARAGGTGPGARDQARQRRREPGPAPARGLTARPLRTAGPYTGGRPRTALAP